MDHGDGAAVRRRRRSVVVAATCLALTLTGCGAAQGDERAEAPGPTIADPDLAGTWSVAELATTDGGTPGPVGGGQVTARIELETDFGGVAVDTSCGSELGAFTLDPDGTAGFSLVGGSTRDCPAADQEVRDDLIAALGAVTSWSQDGERLVLSSPSGDEVTLSR